MPALLQTNLPFPVRRGKVRDVYDLGDRLLLVATDRISAFDWVMPNGIPDKGKILTQISAFWFEKLGVENHLLSLDVESEVRGQRSQVRGQDLAGRSMIVEKTHVVPIECVVRGYLDGSGWKEYQKSGTVCGIGLPAGLVQCSQLPEPIFTPATKEESGHDINISFDSMVEIVGRDLAEDLRRRSLDVYTRAAACARTRGIIIADTKFEWGRVGQVSNLSSERSEVGGQRSEVRGQESGVRGQGSEVILIDEVLTPDSSRFWPADQYLPGRPQPSFDKQFVRDWLETTGWDKNSPPPTLPDDVVAKTRAKYVEAYERLTGKQFATA